MVMLPMILYEGMKNAADVEGADSEICMVLI